MTNKFVSYTGVAYKNHVASDFVSKLGYIKLNGVGCGGTIFLDYDKMIEYLKFDGQEWYVCELKLENVLISFDFGCDYIATIHQDLLSVDGYAAIL